MIRGAARLVVLLVPLVIGSLSGCLSGHEKSARVPGTQGGAPGVGDPAAGVPPHPAAVAALYVPPVWQLSQWWEYAQSSTGSPPGPVTLVVTKAGLANYTVDTTDESTAIRDAEDDVSYVGSIGKAALSGRQNGTKVEFFRFPLVQGEAWRTLWDDKTYDVRVVAVGDKMANLEATENGTLRVRYSYDASAGFFGELTFLDAQGGPAYQLRLHSFGSGFQGKIVRASSYKLLDDNVRGTEFSINGFQVEEGMSQLVVAYSFSCAAPGAWLLSFWAFYPEDSLKDAAACPGKTVVTTVLENPRPDSYFGGISTVGLDLEGWMLVRARNLTVFEFPGR